MIDLTNKKSKTNTNDLQPASSTNNNDSDVEIVDDSGDL